MTRPPRLLATAIPTIAAVLAMGAPAAQAEEVTGPLRPVLDTSLRAAPGEMGEACHTRLRPGAPGVATREVFPGGPGALDVALRGREGDWDVAVFSASGRLVAADASPDAQEIAAGWLHEHGSVTVQACRRSGDADAVPVVLRHASFAGDVAAKAAALRADPPQMVNISVPSAAAWDKVAELDLDLTEHGSATSLGAVLHGEEDRQTLRDAGLEWDVLIGDLLSRDITARRREALQASSRALPSGNRTTYRRLADYNAELKALAEQNPGLVKLITLPHKTWMGKEVMGIEITTDVNTESGKPAFLNMGVHHAREWPSGEHAIEWAYELINGYKAGDARVKRIVEQSRNIVVPIVNPDGFEASRSAGIGADGGRPQAIPDTALLVAGLATGGEYRRKNCRLPDNSEAGNCLTSAGLAETGVDPNRNYGGLWGGPGATNDLTSQTYYGPGPFSEPETRNIRDLVAANSVVTLITNHTTAGLVLRAPGLAALGDPVDEHRGYKALGDAMAMENGYFSQKSYELYDTTGTTEDWTYNTAGGYGFTFEVYCGAPNYTTGDCDDPAFHPEYALGVVAEYEGTSPQSDHTKDPGRSENAPFGMQAGYNGKGNREAYLIAAESTLDERRHSVIEGKAPAGATLRIKKTFKTETFPQGTGDQAKPILFDDKLEQTMIVPASGSYQWHVNPSTRPIVAKSRGEQGQTGTPSPADVRQGGPEGAADDPNGDGAGRPAVPGGAAECADPAFCNDHPVTVPDNAANRFLDVRAQWSTPGSDWDMELFDDANGSGTVDPGETVISSSQQGTTDFEALQVPTSPGKKYVVRMTNFFALEPYELTLAYRGPEPYQPAQVEAWTLTCERSGAVLETKQVVVDRAGRVTADLPGCAKAAPGTTTPPGGAPGTTPGTGTRPSGGTGTGCVAGSGLRSASVKPSGRGATLGFTRRVSRPVTVDVFQLSRGRRVTGELLMARFGNRASAVRWNGRPNRPGRRLSDGYYLVRYRMALAGGGSDTLRVTLERRNGRFVVRPPFYRRDSCGALASFKLERPAFGGRTKRPLNIAFRLNRPARVTVTVLRGSKVVKRFGPGARTAGRMHRLRLGDSAKLRRGTYRVRIQAVGGGATVNSTLTARKL